MQPVLNSSPNALPVESPAGRQGASEMSSDFQTFLRMLTTQMQNQNPLEPIEASDFAVQLATFSGVEQQVLTNDLLTQMTTRMGLAELGSWVGRSALSSAPVHITGAPVRLVPPEVMGAERAELVVSDLSGRELGRFEVDPTASELIFEMPPPSEGGLPRGHYEMSVESFRGGESLGSHPVLGYARIEEVRLDAGQTLLVLQGGQIIDSASIKGLRE